MSQIRTILVPVDFSERSSKALELAIEFARSFGAKIQLIHCFQPWPSGYAPYDLVIPEDFTREARDAAVQILEQSRAKVEAEGIDVEATLSEELPVTAIVGAAETTDADLIVMGTQGLTGLKHLVIGSVAERTLRSAPCPVLTVNSVCS